MAIHKSSSQYEIGKSVQDPVAIIIPVGCELFRDIMSQSQLLIGGQSSFFVLGSHLCNNCTVIHSSGKKFIQSTYEIKNITPHLKQI